QICWRFPIINKLGTGYYGANEECRGKLIKSIAIAVSYYIKKKTSGYAPVSLRFGGETSGPIRLRFAHPPHIHLFFFAASQQRMLCMITSLSMALNLNAKAFIEALRLNRIA
ncbi:MAG TPA: hypothetical protein VHZ50_05035, partial [Puia sp.]|nr:hypothetical protein [Puia sp.]